MSGRTAGLLLGLGLIATGIAVLVWPGATVVVVGLLLGVGLVLYGIRELAAGPDMRDEDDRRTAIAIGIVSVLVGGVVLFMPLLTAVAIGTIIGIAWIVEGVAAIAAGVTRPGHRLLRLATGALSLVAGVVVIVQPGLSLVAIAWFAGLWAILVGVVVLGVSFIGTGEAASTP